ncbi:DUF1450 domain-containing protein [Effusibacillus dendaii]|uniref:DUF1450 domain-containing protein n=1 Tax=Effusibacillus dendaii TaxID=2743772 RepID=A0A7I8DHP7_9BACL|nr:DUF1450 domain-containing protein [Effusibacillus dendaii]BCJ88539.1 hypothetical protein skT53_35240 [Effusibacillus dendaii]
MENQVFYCFRNAVGKSADQITEKLAQQQAGVDLICTACMKLCMLCDQRLITILNRQVIIAKTTEELIAGIQHNLENSSGI